MAQLSFRLDGDILKNGQPSLRTIGTIATHFQSAISRAYLDIKTGNVRKYSRVLVADYENIDFWLLQERQGGWIIDTIANSDWGDRVAQKLVDVMNPIYTRVSRGVERELFDVDSYLQTNRELLTQQAREHIPTFNELKANPPQDYNLSYVDKSIARYVANATSPIRSDAINAGSISFSIASRKVEKTYFFDKRNSQLLHSIASERKFYNPVIYKGQIDAMDRSKLNGFFYNIDNDRTKQKLLFRAPEHFTEAQNYFRDETIIKFVGMPCIESGSLDINSGDVLFVGVVA